MEMKRLKKLLKLMTLSLIVGWSAQAAAQDNYPDRPITIVVPLSAGGSVDTVARLTAAYLSDKWKVPVNVVNKPGGNTVPASLEVFTATPDGYTFLADANPSSSLLSVVVKNLPFKVLDRTFIAMTAFTPMVALVQADMPYKSMQELAEAAKKDPTNFSWASGGGANTSDYMARQFFKAIDVDVTKTKPVMGKGGSELVALTAGGHVMFGSGTVVASLPTVNAGLVRPLAVAGDTRWPDLPDLPTTDEVGFPTVDVRIWTGISGPPQLPSQVVETWNVALHEMVKDPEYVAKLKRAGALPFYKNAAEMKDYIAKETAIVAELWRSN